MGHIYRPHFELRRQAVNAALVDFSVRHEVDLSSNIRRADKTARVRFCHARLFCPGLWRVLVRPVFDSKKEGQLRKDSFAPGHSAHLFRPGGSKYQELEEMHEYTRGIVKH
jgi:hypothetical protein